MNEIVADIFKKHGLPAVAGALALGGMVWYLAQVNAQPGTSVKVLWGLVEYTKDGGSALSPNEDHKEDSPVPPLALTSPKAVPTKGEPPESVTIGDPGQVAPKVESPPVPSAGTPSKPTEVHVAKPTEIHVSHGLTVESLPSFVSNMRSVNGLRPLRPLETGRSIADSPLGTFFYVSGYHLDFGVDEGFPLKRGSIGQALQAPRLLYEFQHRPDNKLYLIAFTSESDADRLRNLSGDGQQLKVTLFPQIWDAQTSLVELPIERLRSAAVRDIQLDESGKALTAVDVNVE